jgi:rhomboid family GlyGly-CTERM serine protease
VSISRGAPPRLPWATATVAVIAVGVALVPAWAPALLYDRAGIGRGEWWRLWSGHLVHFGPAHLAWNLAVLLPAGLWAERIAALRTRLLLTLAPPAMAIVLLIGLPDLARYSGLSGLASALLAFLACTQLRRAKGDRWFWWSVLGLLLGKIGAEVFSVHPLFARFATDDVQPVPLAHAAGLGVAVLMALPRSRA